MRRKVIIITALVFYFLGIGIFSANSYLSEKRKILNYVDKDLEFAVKHALFLCGQDYHSRIEDSESIDEDEDIDRIINLTKYAEENNLEYIYTVIKKEGKIYFTSSSSNDEELKLGEYIKYFDEYKEAPEVLSEIFENGEAKYTTYSGRYGDNRSFFYPYVDNGKVKFVIVGDVASSDIQALLKKNFIKSAGIGLFFMMLLLPFLALLIALEKREKDALVNELLYDSQTGLPNRKHLFNDIVNSKNPSLFLGNIDSFKQYNDFYGYHIGDYIIKEIARRLIVWQNNCYSEKCKLLKIYKLQADEYAVLIDAKMPEDERRMFAAEITLTANGEHIHYKKQVIPVSVTFGVSFLQKPEKSDSKKIQLLMADADMALKKAKILQKHFLMYDQSMNIRDEYKENIKWTKSIRFSIQNDQIFPFFQPIINNETGEIEKFECLIRMIDETGELIYPTRFLDVAKKSKSYPELTQIMVQKAFETFKNTNYEFSINLSLDDILNIDTSHFIYSILEEYKNVADRCVFELLETENIENQPEVTEFIAKVKEYKCKIAIDDFGSGYSNFSYVTGLNIDYIKIDASMIKNLVSDVNSRIVTETIVAFCKKMKIKTIAEFVYNRAVYDEVRNLGIDFSQGYYFGKPEKSISQ